MVGAGFGGSADLSGGQWQRLALARLLDHDAPLIVLDEINTYWTEHPAVPLIVCSRLEEYQHLGTRLEPRKAVTLQPLSNEAIDEALASGGARQATLRLVVERDATLRDALRTPSS